MQDDPHYQNVSREVSEFLARAHGSSVRRQAFLPSGSSLIQGFGFAKTLEHNLSLFKHMEALHELGRPLLVGVSRKSMIGKRLE